MIAQRPPGAAPAIQGVAEALPLEDKSVDATMGVFTMQHWDDVDRGLAEVLRVTRDRVVFLTLDLDVTAEMWLCRDYLPEIVEHDRRTFPSIERLEAVLPDPQVEAVPVPADCTRRLLRRALEPARGPPRPAGPPGLLDLAPAAAPRWSSRPWIGSAATSRAASGTAATDSCATQDSLDVGLRLVSGGAVRWSRNRSSRGTRKADSGPMELAGLEPATSWVR